MLRCEGTWPISYSNLIVIEMLMHIGVSDPLFPYRNLLIQKLPVCTILPVFKVLVCPVSSFNKNETPLLVLIVIP